MHQKIFELEKHLSLSFHNLKSYVQLANFNQYVIN